MPYDAFSQAINERDNVGESKKYLQRADVVASAYRQELVAAKAEVEAKLRAVEQKISEAERTGMKKSHPVQRLYDGLQFQVAELKKRNENNGVPSEWPERQKQEWERVLQALVEMDEHFEPGTPEQMSFDASLDEEERLTEQMERADTEIAEVDAWGRKSVGSREKLYLDRVDILSDLFLSELTQVTSELVADMKKFSETNGPFSDPTQLFEEYTGTGASLDRTRQPSDALKRFRLLSDLVVKARISDVYGAKANTYEGEFDSQRVLLECALQAQLGKSNLEYFTTYKKPLNPLRFAPIQQR